MRQSFLRTLVALTSAAFAVSALAAPAQAASKLSLRGSTTITQGEIYLAKVFLTPAKPNVAVSVFKVLKSSLVKVGTAKTNSAGVATFRLSVTSSKLELRAKLSANPKVQSNLKQVNVLRPSAVEVDWPIRMGCEAVVVKASINPPTPDRLVQLQWWNAQAGWEVEDFVETDANGVASLVLDGLDAGGSLQMRVWLPATARLGSGQSDWVDLEFETCVSPFTLSAAQTATGPIRAGDTYSVAWEVTGWFSRAWNDRDAALYLEVCDRRANACLPSDLALPIFFEDAERLVGDESGTLSWTAVAGDYLVRVAVWDLGELVEYIYWELSVSP